MKQTYTAEFRTYAVAMVLEEKYNFKDAPFGARDMVRYGTQ